MHDPDCIFCKIASGEILSEKLYDDGEIFVIKDINPLTPIHYLIIPHEHIPTLLDLPEEKAALIGRIHLVANKMAKEAGLDEKGFRLMHNVKEWGGQVVMHIHFHLLGGKKLK